MDVPILLLFNYLKQDVGLFLCFLFFSLPFSFVSSGLVQFICIACGVSSLISCLGQRGEAVKVLNS